MSDINWLLEKLGPYLDLHKEVEVIVGGDGNVSFYVCCEEGKKKLEITDIVPISKLPLPNDLKFELKRDIRGNICANVDRSGFPDCGRFSSFTDPKLVELLPELFGNVTGTQAK